MYSVVLLEWKMSAEVVVIVVAVVVIVVAVVVIVLLVVVTFNVRGRLHGGPQPPRKNSQAQSAKYKVYPYNGEGKMACALRIHHRRPGSVLYPAEKSERPVGKTLRKTARTRRKRDGH